MKGLKIVLVGLAVLALLVIGVGFLLPASVHVERSVEIAVPQDELFTYVNDFRAFNRWSPWAAIDPNTSYRFEGPPNGVGARMSWSSEHPSVGVGSQEIVESEPHRYVKVNLDFGAQGLASAYYQLDARGRATQVIWGFDFDFGNDIMGRYVGLLFDRMVGNEYEKGLATLKSIAESDNVVATQ